MEAKTAYLCLGSNRGDRLVHLRRALDEISARTGRVAGISPVYESDPVGFEDKTRFLNLVAEVTTELEPVQLITVILGIERMLGRERAEDRPAGPKVYLPRTIDIDILFYADLILDLPGLIVPHPRLAERRFVLVPLNDIAPDLVHPVLRKTMRQLLAECRDFSRVEVFT